MDDKERLNVLEQALAQMLKPVKGIPFSVIVKSVAERQVIQIDKANAADIELLKKLGKAIQFCALLTGGHLPYAQRWLPDRIGR